MKHGYEFSSWIKARQSFISSAPISRTDRLPQKGKPFPRRNSCRLLARSSFSIFLKRLNRLIHKKLTTWLNLGRASLYSSGNKRGLTGIIRSVLSARKQILDKSESVFPKILLGLKSGFLRWADTQIRPVVCL